MIGLESIEHRISGELELDSLYEELSGMVADHLIAILPDDDPVLEEDLEGDFDYWVGDLTPTWSDE